MAENVKKKLIDALVQKALPSYDASNISEWPQEGQEWLRENDPTNPDLPPEALHGGNMSQWPSYAVDHALESFPQEGDEAMFHGGNEGDWPASVWQAAQKMEGRPEMGPTYAPTGAQQPLPPMGQTFEPSGTPEQLRRQQLLKLVRDAAAKGTK